MQAPPVSRQLYLDAARRVIGAAHDEVAQPPEKLAATRQIRSMTLISDISGALRARPRWRPW